MKNSLTLTMKRLGVILLLILLKTSGIAQDTIWVNGIPKITKRKTAAEMNPSPLKKDDYIFELFYGYPFIPIREAEVFGVDFIESTKAINLIRNTNHLGARVDYQLNEDYSVGLEFTYASTEFKYRRYYKTPSTPTGTTTPTTTVTSTDSIFTAKVTKVRFLAKVGMHFNISERFDAYGTAGFGFKQFTYETKDGYLSSSNLLNDIIPVAIRVSVGGRFFLSENIAFHVEGGVGGPIMQMGVSYKMH
jgi:opacity protein-like surface antigen